jgi:hypothetical protein
MGYQGADHNQMKQSDMTNRLTHIGDPGSYSQKK